MYGNISIQLLVGLTTLFSSESLLVAELITFGFTGEVTVVPAELESEFSVGESIIGSYTFDSTAEITFFDPLRIAVTYGNSITSFHAIVGGDYTIQRDVLEEPDNYIWVGWNGSTDGYTVEIEDITGPSVDGYEIAYVNFFLSNSRSNLFSSDELPLTPPDITQFRFDFSHIVFLRSRLRSVVNFRLTTLELIPEPTTCGLAMIATLCLVVGTRPSIYYQHIRKDLH